MDDIYTYELAVAEAVNGSGVAVLLATTDSIPDSLIDAIIEEV